MDDRQKSYVTAPTALMVLGRHTPAPDADALLRMTQQFYTLTFALYVPVFSPSLTIGGQLDLYHHTLIGFVFC